MSVIIEPLFYFCKLLFVSVDHRAIDGTLAARWLAAFTARMENPLGAVI
jgi:pyruvate/2-oxoglutarate dehydrogenase complex dihydrolipoamide acyltransferase (E2) component